MMQRVQDLGVSHLEHVFAPPGLPLVDKGGGEATTTILVRGRAGTGKTMLAIALAAAIARDRGGIVLHLTTEFSPAEVAFKVELLAIPGGVAPRPDGLGGPGGVVVRHLALTDGIEGATTSQDVKRLTIDAVWEAVHPKDPPRWPFRVVVIDAFSLPDRGEDQAVLRADLLTFLQALEKDGVSTIIVEEAGVSATDTLPFLVDVAFEPRFTEDRETGELRRELVCWKSRYARAHPGPHPYGLEGARPAAWVDLLRCLPDGEPPLAPARVLFVGQRGTYVVPKASVIAVSLDGKQPRSKQWLNALEVTPGVRMRFANLAGDLLESDGGIPSLAWSVFEAAREDHHNVIFVQDVASLLHATRTREQVLRTLHAWARLGALVVVNDQTAAILSLQPILEVHAGGIGRGWRPFRPRRLRLVGNWITSRAVAEWTANDLAGRHPNQEATARRIVDWLSTPDDAPPWNASSTAPVRDLQPAYACAAACLTGGRAPIQDLPGPRGRAWTSWAHWIQGDIQAAARTLFGGMSEESRDPAEEALWAILCAIYAGNEDALDVELDAHPNLFFPAKLLALAVHDRLVQASTLLGRFVEEGRIKDWEHDLLEAEIRLASERPDQLDDAIRRLLALADDSRIPDIHRADVHHNLGVASITQRRMSEAQASFQRAIELNPQLVSAQSEIAGLGVD
jgi:KaiC/GvpD/RAD55 family RecA-like ATPase